MRALIFLLGTLLCVHTGAGFSHEFIPGSHEISYPCCGIVRGSDRRLDGIWCGSSHSRPYEYFWASKGVHLRDLCVLDLEIGLPSQCNWWQFVVKKLNPALYVGIDSNPKMQEEELEGAHFSLRAMDMTCLEYDDEQFDVAMATGVFAKMPLDRFQEVICEIHRVLKKDGLLVFTLEERWDETIPWYGQNSWNFLEQDIVERGWCHSNGTAFGLPAFLDLIQEYFVLADPDVCVEVQKNTIRSAINSVAYYAKTSRDEKFMHNKDTNSCVSYAIVQKIAREEDR